MTDGKIISGLRDFDEEITKQYFYGYCRRAYDIYDHKYQLRSKTGLDFYSLAHDYYIGLLMHQFKPFCDKPDSVRLSTWMMRGFNFVVLDALKAYNKEFEHQSSETSEVVLEYVRSTDQEEGMMDEVMSHVETHCFDKLTKELTRMILVEGYKQKDVAEMLHVTPSAVNQRYKKIMDEVITPFVIEHYSAGLYLGKLESTMVDECCGSMVFDDIQNPTYFSRIQEMEKRITPEFIETLRPNEIFVFGSNLQGMHAGGAARAAHKKFGAEWGKGVGMQGQSYAIPTMQGGVDTIKPYVDEFIQYAKQHSEKTFLVTPIGCGIAGFEPDDIAPLFEDAREMENIYLPESFLECLE